MKQLLFLLVISVFWCPAFGQLKADAGRDTAWCSPNWNNEYSPQLGGFLPASSGTPPYSYYWQTFGIPASSSFLLDTITVAHPKLIYCSIDSAFIRLRVSDALGATAFDTVKVYYSHLRCPFADYPIYKKPADTVQLKEGYTCWGTFGPITFSHWDTSAFLADSTDLNSKCWCPINYFHYSATYINRIGCSVNGWVDIYIQPSAVGEQCLQSDDLAIVPNPATSQSQLKCSAAWLGSEVVFTGYDGREVARFIIGSVRAPLPIALQTQAPGIYQYKVVSPSGSVSTGKFVLE
jgi:hypothetical protein